MKDKQQIESEFSSAQFCLAVTFVHEIGGHLFITYLGGGRDGSHTPNVGPFHLLATSNDDQGESGWTIEEMIFGGSVRIIFEKGEDDSQVRCAIVLSSFGCSLTRTI